MAQDVLIAGALFPDVPAVRLPDGNGAFHAFVDTSDANAAAADIAQGKTAYVGGEKVVGTASGGGGGGGSAEIKALIERTVTTIELPNDLTTIGKHAFSFCTSLAFTSLPSTITSIDNNGFYNCASLALTSLPSGLTSINASTFYGCTNLALTSLPSGVTSIGAYAFQNCTSLALSSLPSAVTSIGTYAFCGCTGLTSISCDGAVTTFGNDSFRSCTNLVSASFPNMAVASFGTVFGNTTVDLACQNLEFADIGKTKQISTNAFYNCRKLETLVLRRTGEVCALANVNAFTSTPLRGYNSLKGTVYVPSALIDTYKNATNWKTLYNGGTVSFAAIEGSAYEI